MKNPDLPIHGMIGLDPVLGPFWRRFLKYFYITIVGAKIVLRKGACNSELNFAPKAQNLTFAEGELQFLKCRPTRRPTLEVPS